MHAAEEEELGAPETLIRGCTTTLENSESDDAMTEMKWTEEESNMTPTKQR